MQEYDITVDAIGTIRLYQNGVLSRKDGPAVETSKGDKEWWLNGQLHRIGGPAVEWASGHKWWYQNGQLHRTDGPAIEYIGGYKNWYIDGIEYTEEEFNELTNPTKELIVEEYNVTVDDKGTILWYQNGKLNRHDGPAVEKADGTKIWLKNDNKHRLDGPAVVCYHGNLIVWAEYWIDGVQYSQVEFERKISPVKELTIQQISDILGYDIMVIKG